MRYGSPMPTSLILLFLLACDPRDACEETCTDAMDACYPNSSQNCAPECARASYETIDAYLSCNADAHAPEEAWDDVSCSDAAICTQPIFTDL